MVRRGISIVGAESRPSCETCAGVDCGAFVNEVENDGVIRSAQRVNNGLRSN